MTAVLRWFFCIVYKTSYTTRCWIIRIKLKFTKNGKNALTYNDYVSYIFKISTSFFNNLFNISIVIDASKLIP